MPRLALYTFGVLKSPLADPTALVREFHESGDAVYPEISEQPGYLAHAEPAGGARGSLFDLDWGVWGEFAVPAWYGRGRTAETIALATTLSLWNAPDPAFDAVYSGLHRRALNRRHDWFERTPHPNHVLWWTSDTATPTWQQGVAKLEHLHTHAPGPHAFTFPRPYTPTGTPTPPRSTAQPD